MFRPMALTVIGGLAVSTLLTLVVVPVVYDLLDRRGDAWYAARARAAQAVSPDRDELAAASVVRAAAAPGAPLAESPA